MKSREGQCKVLDPQFFCEIANCHLLKISDTWPLPTIRVLPFWRSSHNMPILPPICNNVTECSCCSGNKPLEIIHHQASWNYLTWENTLIVTLHHSPDWKYLYRLVHIYGYWLLIMQLNKQICKILANYNHQMGFKHIWTCGPTRTFGYLWVEASALKK